MTRKKQRATLKDVAREANVSSMTVSRVINNTGRISQATRDRVRDAITRLDYRPSRAARALVTNKTFMIGLIVPDITNPFFSEMVQGVEAVAWERHYSVLLANTNETPAREEAVLNQLEETTVDGVIICDSRLPEDVLLPLLEQQRAVVVLNRQVPEHLASVVRNQIGYEGRTAMAIRHLVGSGRRKIGYLCLKHSAMKLSLDMYANTLRSEGIEADCGWYRVCAPTWNSGYEQGCLLLTEHPELDAVIAGNDLVALGLMRAARDANRRVPDDLAIVGGDDTLLSSQVTPSLTTFRVPKYEMGMIAAQLLFKRIEGDTQYRECLYTEELIVRESAP